MKAAIEVAKREDNAGVGTTKERYAWDKKWWEGHYASAADKFAAAVGRAGACSSSESESESDDDEAELMMKLGAALGKDGIVSSGSKADLKLMEELASGNHRGSTFGGRSGKLERIAKFEAEQLAKYGVQNGAAAPPVVVTATATTTVTKSSKKTKKEKTKKEKTKHAARDSDSDRSAGDVELVRGVAYEGEPSTSTKERDWWSKAGFAWGGVVGSKREQDLLRQGDDDDDATKSTKRGFTEDDQENLFKSAHETGVVRGTHRGLGGKGLIKTEWTGKRKTSFDDDDDDDKKSRGKKDKKEKKEKKEKKGKSSKK